MNRWVSIILILFLITCANAEIVKYSSLGIPGMVNKSTFLRFGNIHKCTRSEKSLVCSQRGPNTDGFVFFFESKKLYTIETSSNYGDKKNQNSQKASFNEYQCDKLNPSDTTATPQYYFCDSYKKIQGYECEIEEYIYPLPRKSSIIHYYEDKYGFSKQKRISGDAYNYCTKQFSKILP